MPSVTAAVPPGARNKVSAADAVDVTFIGDIVDVDLRFDVLGELFGDQRHRRANSPAPSAGYRPS